MRGSPWIDALRNDRYVPRLFNKLPHVGTEPIRNITDLLTVTGIHNDGSRIRWIFSFKFQPKLRSIVERRQNLVGPICVTDSRNEEPARKGIVVTNRQINHMKSVGCATSSGSHEDLKGHVLIVQCVYAQPIQIARVVGACYRENAVSEECWQLIGDIGGVGVGILQ